MLENYDFIGERGDAVFQAPPRPGQPRRRLRARLRQAPRHARREEQAAAVEAVRFKCNVLWAQLDALHHAYVTPGLIPPGAFRPEGA